MMPSNYSDHERHIWSVPTPTGSQLLPGCGMAWGIQLDGKKNVVVATVGEAASRQGDFFEAVCFAKERKLPVLFIVEDNAYGISSPTRKINPLALGVLEPNEWTHLGGEEVQEIYEAGAAAMEKMRDEGGPHFWWIKMERLSSHTSSDDQKLYRSADELAECEKHDPVTCWKEKLIAAGDLTEVEFSRLENEIKERVRTEYSDPRKGEDPSLTELRRHGLGSLPRFKVEVFPRGKYRFGDTVNRTLRPAL